MQFQRDFSAIRRGVIERLSSLKETYYNLLRTRIASSCYEKNRMSTLALRLYRRHCVTSIQHLISFCG